MKCSVGSLRGMGILAVCMLVFLSLWGCSRGGGGGSTEAGVQSDSSSAASSDTANASSGSYGKVGILLKDGPADDYDHIWVTVTEVSLIPSGDDEDPVIIFSSDEGYRFDLLEYRDKDFLLTLKETVPVGKYEKVRLKVSKVEAQGGPCDDLQIDVPSGKIDLSPRGSFEVTAGSTMYLRLDIDANKSINLHAAGSSGKCIFRPVVFADVLTRADLPSCPTFIRGNVKAVHDTDEDGIPESFTIAREHSCMGSMLVKVDDDTLVFTDTCELGTPKDIKAGQEVKVRGLIDDGIFKASLVIIGDTVSVKGVVNDPVESGSFGFTADAGEAISGAMGVVLAGSTPVISGCNDPVARSSIKAGMHLEVIGRYVTDTKKLYAAIVFVLPMEGTIDSVTPLDSIHPDKGFKFIIVTDSSVKEEVVVADEFYILIEGDGLLEPSALMNLDLSGCHVQFTEEDGAMQVKLIAISLEGTVKGVDAAARTLLVDSTCVRVMPLATGVDISGEGSDCLIPFGDVDTGDLITCFGFKACSGSKYGFYAFAYLVKPVK